MSRNGIHLLPEERIRLCQDVEDYINKTKLKKKTTKHMESAHSKFLENYDTMPIHDVSSNNNTRKKPGYQCQECQKTFTLKRNRYRHVQVQHKGIKYQKKKKNFEAKVPKFDCQICGKKFMFKQSLERHVQVIHEEKKPYKCPSCGFEFGYKRALTRHVANIHK